MFELNVDFVKAPHHSLSSWTSFCRRNGPISNVIKHRDHYKHSRSSNSDNDNEADDYSEDGNFVSSTDSEIETIAGRGSTDEDERNIGRSGDPIGPPEMRAMARYIHEQKSWNGISSTRRISWTRFYKEVSRCKAQTKETVSWEQSYSASEKIPFSLEKNIQKTSARCVYQQSSE